MICFLMTTTPVKSAAPLHGQTVSSGEEGNGLLIDQVGKVGNGLLHLSELVQILQGRRE